MILIVYCVSIVLLLVSLLGIGQRCCQLQLCSWLRHVHNGSPCPPAGC